MRVKQITALICLTFFIVISRFAIAQTGPKTTKEHLEQITKGIHTYKIKVGGTLDEFNTAEYIETYSNNMRLESKFQPNRHLVIENIGDTDVVNPRIVVNGRRNWFGADDILSGIFTPNMTDAEKAMAIYSFLAGHDVQAHENDRRPGPEIPGDDSHPSRNAFQERANPVKAVNCYYCGGCQFEATNFVILARRAGFVARPVWLNTLDRYGAHCVAEVWYDGGWHLFDPDQRTFYLDSDNTTVASFETLHKNPALVSRNHDGGFASKGLKDRSSQYANIWPPHVMAVENWLGTMAMTLRPGEQFTWRWDNIGKYRCGDNRRNIRPSRPQGLLPYQLANGKLIYRPKLADTELFHRGIVSELNIKPVGTGPEDTQLRPEVIGWPGFVIYKLSSPYPIVGGQVGAKFFRKTDRDKCRIYISVHDSDWVEVWSERKIGEVERYRNLDDYLNPLPTSAVYQYFIKFEVHADQTPADVFMTQFSIETDVQMAATALPSLSAGVNKIVYSDDSKGPRKVQLTHGWTESSETAPPLAPAGPVSPADGGTVNLASLTKLTWQTPKDPDGDSIVDYHVQLGTRSDMMFPLSPNFDRIISSSQPEWMLPQGWFVKGRTYYWRLRAKDSWGAWSDWSKTWKFKVTE